MRLDTVVLALTLTACGAKTGLDGDPENISVIQVAAGGTYACELRGSSAPGSASIVCWGDVTTEEGYGPTGQAGRSVAGMANAVSIAAGGEHVCARMVDGTVSCWGSGRFGDLGFGFEPDRWTPRRVPGVANVIQISGTCALLGDGRLECWGFGNADQPDIFPLLLPTVIDGFEDVTEQRVSRALLARVRRSARDAREAARGGSVVA